MPINVDDVEAIRNMLSGLPRNQPKQMTKHQAIEALASELGAAQRRGYSAGDLARLISERGIDVSGTMLKHYLRRIRRPRKVKGRSTSVAAEKTGAISMAPVRTDDAATKQASGTVPDSPKVGALPATRKG
jgi:hypothetical protein